MNLITLNKFIDLKDIVVNVKLKNMFKKVVSYCFWKTKGMNMKLVEINICDYGSTGKIMFQLAEIARLDGNVVQTFSRKWKGIKNEKKNHTYFGSFFENVVHRILGIVTGYSECFSIVGTLSLISKLQEISPDIIHLHNLHGSYINLPILFHYIKKHNIKVVWTLHDCWSFTGHCPHFTLVKCDKWKTGCYNCPSYQEYPKSFFDNSRFMYKLKKKWFMDVKHMVLVTPSKWLSNLVEQSFLGDYPVRVINNGIDLDIFKPMPSNFRHKYSCEDKHIVLGVAFGWGKRKGLDVFIELAKRLDKEKYQIVLVGTDDNVDKQLPDNIISIHKTQNQRELAELYTVADVFANPTREENYPTVNMESIACGTPVITFKTGGSPEILDETCGSVVECDDIDAMQKEIIRICESKPYSVKVCLKKSKSFDKNEKFKEYIRLYEVLNEQK